VSIRTQIYLPEDLYNRLKRRSQSDGKPMAQYIRESLQKYLDEEEKAEAFPDDPIWKIGRGLGEDDDLSTEHDRYLYSPGKGSQRE
jgi:predicted DNA-binding protein